MSSPCQEKRTPFFKFLTAFRIFKDNIFFGIGPKMFREVCKRKKYIVKTKLDASVDGCQTSPHNYYLQILTETGIFGIIPIIGNFVFSKASLQRISCFLLPILFKMIPTILEFL